MIPIRKRSPLLARSCFFAFLLLREWLLPVEISRSWQRSQKQTAVRNLNFQIPSGHLFPSLESSASEVARSSATIIPSFHEETWLAMDRPPTGEAVPARWLGFLDLIPLYLLDGSTSSRDHIMTFFEAAARHLTARDLLTAATVLELKQAIGDGHLTVRDSSPLPNKPVETCIAARHDAFIHFNTYKRV